MEKPFSKQTFSETGWGILIMVFCIFFYTVSAGITAILYYAGVTSMDTSFYYISLFGMSGFLLVIFLLIFILMPEPEKDRNT